MAVLWNNYRYKSFIECLVDTPIRAFDIRKANISIFKEKGIIDQDTYDYLFNSERDERQIVIGKMIGDNPNLSEILSQGILEAKRLFFEMNGIEDSEVLEIDNDAIYIMGSRPIYNQQVTPLVYFKLEEQYTSFYSVSNIRYFYLLDRVNRIEWLRTKGLGDNARTLHEHFMIEFLKELFLTAQSYGIPEALELLSAFYKSYQDRSLELGFYRNLNNMSMFSIQDIDEYAKYWTDVPNPRYKKIIDISYNEKILREFNRLLSGVYMNGNRR